MATIKKITKAQRRTMPWKSKSIYRTRQDIASWNRALNMAQNAEEPRMWPLQLLYNEVLTDALLKSQIEIRKQQIFSAGFNLKDSSGNVNDDATRLLKQNKAIAKIFDAIMEARLRGYSVIELDFDGAGKLVCEEIPRTNIVPQKGLFYQDYTDDLSPVSYRELREYGTWVLEFNEGNIGLLNSAIPHVLFKRFAQSCWSELCEIYGIPPRVLKTNTQDDSMLNRGEQMMKDMGAAAYFIIDETEELSFANGVSTNGDVYKNLITFCNQETTLLINGAILGQDTQHGTRGKEQVSQDLQWLLVQSDMNLIETYFKDVVMPALVNIGYIPEGLTFEFEEAEDTNKLFDYTQKLLSYYDIDPEWIKQKFGVEVSLKKIQNSNPGEGLSFFQGAPAVMTGAKDLCCTHHTLAALPNSEAFNDESFAKRVWDADGTLFFDLHLFNYTADTLLTGLKKGTQSKGTELVAGFRYGNDDPVMLASYEMNLFRFSAAKTVAEIQELNALFRKSASFDEFSQQAAAKMQVFNKAWLEAEYNSAMSVGSAAMTYHRLMDSTKSFPYWQYKTIDDDRVRPEHRALHDIILPYNDPRWKKIFPPNGWRCRCYVIGKMKDEVTKQDIQRSREVADAFTKTNIFKMAEAQGWGVNRAESGEVFTANQFYIKKFSGQASKNLSELKPESFGLPSYSNAKKTASNVAPVYNKDPEEFYRSLALQGEDRVIRDYTKRPLLLKESDFRKHTDPSSNKYAQRSELLDAMNDTLNKPDEVYLNGADLQQMVYLKYYKDYTMTVNVQNNKGKELSIKSWFKLREIKQTIERWRRGLLLFAKK